MARDFLALLVGPRHRRRTLPVDGCADERRAVSVGPQPQHMIDGCKTPIYTVVATILQSTGKSQSCTLQLRVASSGLQIGNDCLELSLDHRSSRMACTTA